MKYLRKFDSVQGLNDAVASSKIDFLGLAYNNGTPMLKKAVDTRLVCVYNVVSTQEPTQLLNISNYFTSMEVDGVELAEVVSDYTFSTTGLHTVKLTLDDTTIGEAAFYSCTGLTSVTIPNGVTNTGVATFGGCSGLTSVILPNSVTIIDDECFADCSGLTSITIPNNVELIGAWAFSVSGLTTVISLPTTPPTYGAEAFKPSNVSSIYVPAWSVDVYKAALG